MTIFLKVYSLLNFTLFHNIKTTLLDQTKGPSNNKSNLALSPPMGSQEACLRGVMGTPSPLSQQMAILTIWPKNGSVEGLEQRALDWKVVEINRAISHVVQNLPDWRHFSIATVGKQHAKADGPLIWISMATFMLLVVRNSKASLAQEKVHRVGIWNWKNKKHCSLYSPRLLHFSWFTTHHRQITELRCTLNSSRSWLKMGGRIHLP